MIDPRRLLTFREVAHHRSFSRAAEALALTQPAVSQQVAALERTVGMPLLVRGPGGVALTEAGELLLDHADAVADRLALADAQLGETAADLRRRLTLGTFASALATIVPEALGRLREDEPGLEADVREAAGDVLVPAVGRGELHVAVVFEDAERPPRDIGAALRRDDLLEESFVAAVPPDHPLAKRRSIALAELADHPWTAPSREHLLARAARRAGFEAPIAFVTSDPMAMARLVAGGLAVTLVPRLLVGSMEGVAIVDVRDAPRRHVYAVTPARGRHPVAGALVEALREAAAAMAPLV